MANPQRKPHEQDVLLQAVRRKFVGYYNADGEQICTVPLHKRPAQPPEGTVSEDEYVLYQDITAEDGTLLEGQQLEPKPGPQKFLRGRVVTGGEALGYAFIGIQLQSNEIAAILPHDDQEFLAALRVVVVRDANGIEGAVPLEENDIPPPTDANRYAVGWSPEEQVAKAYAAAAQDDLEDDEESYDEVVAADGEPTDGQQAS